MSVNWTCNLGDLSDEAWHAVIRQGIDLEDDIEWLFDTVVVDDRQLGFELEDWDEDTDEYVDYLEDVAWLRGGC